MIDQTEMFAVTSLLATGDTREKLKFLFAMYDENGKVLSGVVWKATRMNNS